MEKLNTSAQLAKVICDIDKVGTENTKEKEIGIAKATHIASKVRKLYKEGGRKAVTRANLAACITMVKNGKYWMTPSQATRGIKIACNLVEKTKWGIFSKMWWNMRRICK